MNPDENSSSSSGRGRFFDQNLASSDESSQSSSRARSILMALSQKDDNTPRLAAGRGIFKSFIDEDSPSPQALAKQLEKVSLKPPPVETPVPAAPIAKEGKNGIPVTVETNYIFLSVEPDRGVFEYEVQFEPQCLVQRTRSILINQHLPEIGGTKTLDGPILFLPIKLPKEVTYLESTFNEEKFKITVTFKRQKVMKECIQLYNILFDRIMKTMGMVRFQRKQFDPSLPKIIPQHKLEIWPGYVTAVDQYDGGFMLCLDISHRILTSVTVHNYLTELFTSKPSYFQQEATKLLLGNVVLTRYNNKTYRVDEIDFDKSPKDKFLAGENEMSYIEYYKHHYNITIRDPDQPLLISRKKIRIAGHDKSEMILALVPELCYLTGLTDTMRNDYKVMADVATHTRLSPNQRKDGMRKFCESVNSTPEAMKILSQWGLKIDLQKQNVLKARLLPLEKIYFGKGMSQPTESNGDFNRIIVNNHCLEAVHLTNWAVVYTRRDEKSAQAFISNMTRNSRPLGINVTEPQKIALNDDNTRSYLDQLRNAIKAGAQIVVALCPTARDDRYAAIKKLCCVETPCPSQVINSRTLRNEAKNRGIVQKIALQMNCKLGGSLWSVRIPMKSTMIIGIDTYHEKMSNSVGGFVASINSGFTRWYSKVVLQTKGEEMVHGLCVSMIGAMAAFKKENDSYPERIIIFRDGVGDGQLSMCREYELPQLLDACRAGNVGYNPKITFLVVQKRVNARIFKIGNNGTLGNPEPGTVLDHTITRRYLFDFYLVPQNVNQGTVSPSHFIVVQDDNELGPDKLQMLSYKLCHMYYNWTGTIRVPACCQYAHKIAALVGTHIKRMPDESLADVLYYL